MLREADPVFVTVTVLDELVVPTTVFPKLKLVGLKVSTAVGPPVPVPLRPTSCGLKLALWLTVTAPFTALPCMGLKVINTVHFALAAKVLPQPFRVPGVAAKSLLVA
jgi:hypothetical protein